MTRDSLRRGRRVGQTVLVVDDEPDIRELLEMSLFRMGLEVETAASIAEAKALMFEREFDLCLTDMRLPDGDGLELVRHIAVEGNDLPVAVITAFGSPETAVAALKAGAFDYLTKPLSLEQLRSLIKSALAIPAKLQSLPSESLELIGDSSAMEQVRGLIDKVARSQAPIYISGESGSGKELAARLIHAKSSRKGSPFIAVNCGAIPDNLMESEFFGYRKGAFTGADADRDGFFQAAAGGTLFLDEIAELPTGMQVKLLRAIQEKKVRKVGANLEEPVDVRLICATHQDLAVLVGGGRFRQDLYYRLAVIELKMPPLRDCRDDIGTLAVLILKRIAATGQREAPSRLAEDALKSLVRYDFPGNVRELENILERAVALSAADVIHADDLQLVPSRLGVDYSGPIDRRDSLTDVSLPLPEYLDRIEQEAILKALEATRFNRTAAAKILGITFRGLRYRMARLGID